MMLQIRANDKTNDVTNTLLLDVRYDQGKSSFMYIRFTSEATETSFVIPAMRVAGNSRYLSVSFLAARLGACTVTQSRINLLGYPEGQYHWDAYMATQGSCTTSGGTLYLSGMAYLRPYEGAYQEPSTLEFQPTSDAITMYEP